MRGSAESSCMLNLFSWISIDFELEPAGRASSARFPTAWGFACGAIIEEHY